MTAKPQRGLAAYLEPRAKNPEGKLTVLVELDAIQNVPSLDELRMTDDEFEALCDSIREEGLLQPVLLRPSDDDTYVIVAGRHRCAAHAALGLDEVAAIVRDDLDEAGAAVATGIENLQRKNVSPIEEADAYKAAIDTGLTQKDVAKRVGVSPGTVANRMKLHRIPRKIAERVGVEDYFGMSLVELFIQIEHDDELVKAATKAAIGSQWNPKSAAKKAVAELVAYPFGWTARRDLKYSHGTTLDTTAYGKEILGECDVFDFLGDKVTRDIERAEAIFAEHKKRRAQEVKETNASASSSSDTRRRRLTNEIKRRNRERLVKAARATIDVDDKIVKAAITMQLRDARFQAKRDWNAVAEAVDMDVDDVKALVDRNDEDLIAWVDKTWDKDPVLVARLFVAAGVLAREPIGSYTHEGGALWGYLAREFLGATPAQIRSWSEQSIDAAADD